MKADPAGHDGPTGGATGQHWPCAHASPAAQVNGVPTQRGSRQAPPAQTKHPGQGEAPQEVG